MLDHIFRPRLRQVDFLTEIHHVNQNGEDGGVMYAEIKVIFLIVGNNILFQFGIYRRES